MSTSNGGVKTDEWVWGTEMIVWGYESSHAYTFKIIEPKQGRAGCMSLQYHNEKSETWLVLRGTIWGLAVIGDTVCTRLMSAGDIQNLPTGVIHRLMGVTADARVAEPSTPDRHAADKSVKKDVVRLHCVLGRECVAPRDAREEKIVKQAILYTEEAIAAIERGQMPIEHNRALLDSHGALRLQP